jgi:hypothetical protein
VFLHTSAIDRSSALIKSATTTTTTINDVLLQHVIR